MTDPIAQLIFSSSRPSCCRTGYPHRGLRHLLRAQVRRLLPGRVGPTYLGPWGSLQSFGTSSSCCRKRRRTGQGGQGGLQAGALHRLHPRLRGAGRAAFGPVGGEANLFGYRFDYVLANFDAGLVLFLAMGALTVYGVVLAGWSSNSNYSLLGGLRAGAPDDLLRVGHGLLGGWGHADGRSMSLVDIVDAQKGAFWDCTSIRRSWAGSCSLSRLSPSSTGRPSTWPKPSRNWWPAT